MPNQQKSKKPTGYMERMRRVPGVLSTLTTYNHRQPVTNISGILDPDIPGTIHKDFVKLEDEDYWRSKKCKSFGFRPVTVKVHHPSIKGNRRMLVLVGTLQRENMENTFTSTHQYDVPNIHKLVLHPKRLDVIARTLISLNSEVRYFSAFNFYPRDLNTVPDALRNKYISSCKRRLRSFMKEQRIDTVIIPDMRLYKLLLPGFNQTESSKEVAEVLGRVQNTKLFTIKGKAIPVVPSLDITKTMFPYGDSAMAGAATLGFFRQHVNTAALGRNEYTLVIKDINRIYVETIKDFKKMMKVIRSKRVLCMDTETANLNVIDNITLCLQVATSDKRAYFLPLWHIETPFNTKELAYIKKTLAEYFESGESEYIIFHNAKFDCTRFLVDLGVRYLNHKMYDTMAGEFALDENRKSLRDVLYNAASPYSLGYLTLEYGSDIYLQGDIGKDDRKRMAELPLSQIEGYGWKDVIVPFKIHKLQILRAKNAGDKNFLKTVTHTISDIIKAFISMEVNGTQVDMEYLMKIRASDSVFSEELARLATDLRASPYAEEANKRLLHSKGVATNSGMFGAKLPWRLNLGSVVSRNILLFDVMNLIPKKFKVVKDANGEWEEYPSTSKGSGFQEEFAQHKEVGILTSFNKLSKLKGTFINGIAKSLMENPDSKDHHVRSTYGFIPVVTGRTSASDPGVHQIPSRGDMAKAIKREFISAYGEVFCGQDFNANEIKGWGNASRDKGIVASFYAGMHMRRVKMLAVLTDETILEETRVFEKAYLDRTKTEWDDLTSKEKKVVLKDMRKKKRLTKKLLTFLTILIDLSIKGDIHRLNYERFFNVPAEDVTGEQRTSVKQIIFGILYGKSAGGLASELPDQAKDKSAKLLKLENKRKVIVNRLRELEAA